MIHYHVWFDLKPGVTEADGLQPVRALLDQLTFSTEATGYQLFRNNGAPKRSKLARYHALVEFATADHLSAAMREQVARGIHTGLHGAVVDAVSNFHVEVFTRLESHLADTRIGQYDCAI